MRCRYEQNGKFIGLHNKFPLGQDDARPARTWAEGTVSKEHLGEEVQSPW